MKGKRLKLAAQALAGRDARAPGINVYAHSLIAILSPVRVSAFMPGSHAGPVPAFEEHLNLAVNLVAALLQVHDVCRTIDDDITFNRRAPERPLESVGVLVSNDRLPLGPDDVARRLEVPR